MDSKAECGQLNLTHLARNKKIKGETKTSTRQCPLSSVQVKIREGSLGGIRMTMEKRISERDESQVWSER